MVEETPKHVPHGFEEYLAIALRRRWWILTPLFVCWAIVWTASWLLPAMYQSHALILVERQKVPEQYVVPNVTVNLQDRLQSITQQILSRTRLQEIIDRFHLYSSHRWLAGLLQSADPIEEMRKDIKIELVQSPEHPTELTAFKIDFSANSPELAQQVNTELTSLFINEDLKSQQQLSQNTTAFLESQLAAARTKLEEQEAKVRAFETSHFGDLPGQLQGNVSILTGLQAQLQNTQRTLDEARQQKLYLESLIEQYESSEGNLGGTYSSLDKELVDLRTRLADAQSLHTADYPDVVALKDRIAETEKLKKEIEGELTSNKQSDNGAKGAELGAPTPIMQAESQLKATELEIRNYEKRGRELESRIASYETRLNSTPETEQELEQVSRGYDESKANYDSLLKKRDQSELATNLEQHQQGEQYRVLDPPSLPDKSSSPNHLLASWAGLMLGIGAGSSLVALLELTNVRVRHEKDLKDIVPARVLVAIPHLKKPNEDQFAHVVRWIEVGAAAVMFILMALGNLYSFYKG